MEHPIYVWPRLRAYIAKIIMNDGCVTVSPFKLSTYQGPENSRYGSTVYNGDDRDVPFSTIHRDVTKRSFQLHTATIIQPFGQWRQSVEVPMVNTNGYRYIYPLVQRRTPPQRDTICDPGQRHRGEDNALLKQRDELYRMAQKAHPEPWSGKTINWQPEGPVTLIRIGQNRPLNLTNGANFLDTYRCR